MIQIKLYKCNWVYRETNLKHCRLSKSQSLASHSQASVMVQQYGDAVKTCMILAAYKMEENLDISDRIDFRQTQNLIIFNYGLRDQFWTCVLRNLVSGFPRSSFATQLQNHSQIRHFISF